MLKISPDQMNRLGRSRQTAQWLEMLQLAFPDDPPQGTPAFEKTLLKVAAMAGRQAIFQDRDVARFVCLTYALGESFDTRFPAAQAILADATRPADERLSLLECWADELVCCLDGDR